MKILYIGHPPTYNLYKAGKVPSHWLYGAVEMEKEGNDVIWEWERKSDIFNDIRLVRKYRPDVVFIPTMNANHHFFLLLLTTLGLQRRRIVAYLHHEPSCKRGIKALLYKILYIGVSHFFFLSEKTMDETVKTGFVSQRKCSVPGWGPDMDFYSKVETKEGDYFVSTGKENRDFEILIETFKKTGQPLKIMTAKQHAGSDYTWLTEHCKDIPNIEVLLTENRGNIYPQMLSLMAGAKALVCPLKKDKLNYCVGLSTIADAEGLGKPLIITRNPYHSEDRLKQFNVVDTIDDWVEAISNLRQTTKNEFTMAHCWEAMRKEVTC